MTSLEQLDLAGANTMYFSYGQLLVFDQNESEPGSHWTNQHVAQGFVRRERALGIGTLIEHGDAKIRVFHGHPDSLEQYERVVAIPIVLESGILCIEGPEEYPVERTVHLPVGMYRLTAAQSRASAIELNVDLYLEPLLERTASSRVLKADEKLRISQNLLETGEIAR